MRTRRRLTGAQPEFYPQGVASGDPHSDSVILWTRRPPLKNSDAKELIVEVASDPSFRRVVAKAKATLSAEADWSAASARMAGLWLIESCIV